MDLSTITPEEFLDSIKRFQEVSHTLNDGWRIFEDKNEIHKSYIKKETYITSKKHNISTLCKMECVIFFNLSYGVPSFSFNIWDSTGSLLQLEDVRQLSFNLINQEEFFSVVTQQEHPLFGRPYFIMHPCHTGQLIEIFRNRSKNIIVTFLGLITPLLQLNLPIEYGL